VDKIDISSVARELAEEQISEQLPQEAEFLKEAIYSRHFPYQVAMRHPDPHYSYQQ
jgi:hypothetical protein